MPEPVNEKIPLDAEAIADMALNPTDDAGEDGDWAVFEREGFAWARDVYWVLDHLHERLSRKKTTGARYSLWKFAKTNDDKFIGQLVPKAMGLLEQARNKLGDDSDLVKREKKEVGKLREILGQAVEASNGI